MAASGIHRRSATPTNLASVTASGKQEYDAQSEARKHVGEWVESASSHSNPEHTPEVNEARKAQFNAFGHVVSQQLIPQITTGATHLVLDAPENRNNRAFLNTLKLPDGYTLTIKEAQPDVAESVASSSPDALPSPALHPLSSQRPFALQGGLAQMPLRPLTEAQKSSLNPLVQAYVDSVKKHADKLQNPEAQRCSLLAGILLSDVEDRALSSGADIESFQFELAAQVADKCKQLKDNKPLSHLVPRLPPKWGPMFERDPDRPYDWHDPRVLMGAVEKTAEGKTRPPEHVRSPVVRVKPPVVPFELTTKINPFVAYFAATDDETNATNAREIIRMIRKSVAESGQPEMAMTAAVGDQLRKACERKADFKPLLCFASNLEDDLQGLFLDVLMSDVRIKEAQGLVKSLTTPRVKMDKKQFEVLQKKRAEVVLAINKFPYQSRMMLTNEFNSEIERIASASKDFGDEIRKLTSSAVLASVPKM